MGLLDGFEKLINEHGSAVILKERIALAEDKYSALEQRLSECEAAKIKLNAENEALRLNIEKASIEIQNLKTLTEKVHSSRLEEFREKILLFLAQHKSRTDTEITNYFGVTQQLAVFHLEELKSANMASFSMGIDEDFFGVNLWSIAQDGRRYLVSHGLL